MTDRPNDESRERYQDELKPNSKKKYIYWGLGGLALIAIAGLITFLVLKKKDPKPKPTPPDPDISHYNPYEVLTSDLATMTYKLGINSKVKFNFPYNET